MYAIVLDKNNKELQRINHPTKSWLLEKLQKHNCSIFFRKTTNGQFRSLLCTRNLKKLPRRFKEKYVELINNPHGYDDIVPVWDVNSRDWKSFYYSNVISITIYTGDN